MGNYNPAQPQDIGFEWVAIRDEDLIFSPAVNAVEQGYGFTLANSTQIGDARFYIDDFPPGSAIGQTFLAAIYPRGYEDNSGPIQRVVIPCNSGSITGAFTSLYGSATTLAEAFADPSDSSGLSMTSAFGGGTNGFNAYFGVTQYANQLTGKRIVGVNLLYALAGEIEDVSLSFALVNNALQGSGYGSTSDGTLYGTLPPVNPLAGTFPQSISRMPMGEINPFWSTSLSPYGTSERQPFDYTGLARFEVSAVPRMSISGFIGTSSTSTSYSVTIEYMALEVLYCNEQRVAVGGRSFGFTTGSQTARYRKYVLGTNTIPMRNISQVANPVLAAGEYTLVISSADQGTLQTSAGNIVRSTKTPPLRALRELYSIDPHPGLQIKLPFPATETIVGRTFQSETTHVLPQLSLHATGGSVVTAIHPYGRQIAAPVYGSIVAQQDIVGTVPGALTAFPQVRYWARRFGDTTTALRLLNTSTPTITASITVADFDALPEILDGWKEVNLTFTAPTPSFGPGTTTGTYQWDSVGENVGNRWEILGATSLAISGVPGNLLQTVPAGQVLDAATYAGTSGFAAWLQPNGSAVANDLTSDLNLLFAQDMPTVSGLGISVTSQTVSGIGLNCNLPAACIPTGIGFHNVSWVSLATQYGASSAPITGFGYYELQRMDTIDTDWQTIMQASDVNRASFYDFEPRVGIVSSYRIRACDAYEFCGPWSATVTSTLTSPGVYGVDGNGVLIFTSNERQDGSINLAYTEQWNNNAPETQFDFPEAGDVKLQQWYNHDFVTAFRPLERGGERFEAVLLVQAAAVTPPVLEGVFQSLRDMAWDTVQYICVRNELGDRWWATVIVPDGRVRRNRRLQLARVQIIEVSDTPCVTDPDA